MAKDLQKNKKTARERCIEVVIRNTGWSREEAASHIDDARSRLGIKYIEYRRCRMWEVPLPDQERVYSEYLERKRIEEEEKRIDDDAARERKILSDKIKGDKITGCGKEISFHGYARLILRALTGVDPADIAVPVEMRFDDVRTVFGERYLPDLDFNRRDYEQFRIRFEGHRNISKDPYSFLIMYTDWLFFCRDDGYDMDDYFDYEFYDKETEVRKSFVSANFRDNLTRTLNKKSIILAKKSLFLQKFSSFIKRDWIDFDRCQFEDFRDFTEKHPVFIAKLRISSGGAGILRPDVTGMTDAQLKDLFDRFRQKGGIAEAVIEQHPSIGEFNPETVNTIRVLTLVNADDKAVITGAAARFGRKGCYTDNYHQGGVCALIDVKNGCIRGDAIDRSGEHYKMHPDSGLAFDGFPIPGWDTITRLIPEAAESCVDENRLVGWDIVVDKEGGIELIEGNSIPGFDILQAPDMTGRRREYEEYVSGLVDLKELDNKEIGYWRKKIV